jgi:hypothetical protein
MSNAAGFGISDAKPTDPATTVSSPAGITIIITIIIIVKN